MSVIPASAQPAAQGPAPEPRALVKTMPSGTATWELVLPRKRESWGIKFDRVPDWRPTAERPAPSRIYYAHQLVGSAMVVEVLVGHGPQAQTLVSTVTMQPGERVLVNELREFGVEPIELANVPLRPATNFPPTATSASPDIEVSSIELETTPVPGYRVTLRKLSGRSVVSLHVQTWRGDQKALSLSPRGEGGQPFLYAGRSNSFKVGVPGGLVEGDTFPADGVSPVPLDRIDIEAVNWDDGSLHGTMPYKFNQEVAMWNAGVGRQLEQVTAILRTALNGGSPGGTLLSALRTRFESLSDGEPSQLPRARDGMRAIKVSALSDVVRYENGRGTVVGDDERAWLRAILSRYESMLRTVRNEPVRR